MKAIPVGNSVTRMILNGQRPQRGKELCQSGGRDSRERPALGHSTLVGKEVFCMTRTRLTVSDWYCGAGGSSSGAVYSGVEVVAAANHWKLAIDTHNTNHPATDHFEGDLAEKNPADYPATDILWASPECRKHKPIKDRKRKNANQLDLFTKNEPKAEDVRSRANAWTVCKFASKHRYRVIIVENIIEFRAYWEDWDAWLSEMHRLGYKHKACYFNSMFFHPLNGCSDFAPQSRDRVYVVFWRRGHPEPDLDFRPIAWCLKCGGNVHAVQSWKKATKPWGVYGKRGQYWYCCPGCGEIVTPYYYAAWNAVDWSIPAPRIGDRARPLKPNTLKRIRIGLEKYGSRPLQIQLGYSHCTHPENRVSSLLDTMPTQTARQSLAFIVSARDKPGPASIIDLENALPSTTTTNVPFLVEMYGKSNSRNITDPVGAFTSVLSHGLAVPPFVVRLYGTGKTREMIDPIGSLTANGVNHALAVPFVSSYYGGSNVIKGIDDPVPTQSTVDRHSLVIPNDMINIEDVGFRMFQPHEVKDGMGFNSDYVLLGTNRDQVKLAGNAVTPPVAEWLFRQVKETFEIR